MSAVAKLADLLAFELPDCVPHEPTDRQWAAMSLGEELEVLYGGAAGGGKSDWLLMEALRYVDVPGYAALLLRAGEIDTAVRQLDAAVPHFPGGSAEATPGFPNGVQTVTITVPVKAITVITRPLSVEYPARAPSPFQPG